MEFAFCSRQAMAALEDVETGRLRRFPNLPPPPYGDSNENASPVNAALARRREELVWELTKVRDRQDMILRELVQTEHAMGMGFTAAGYNPVPTPPSSQDYWRSRTPPVNLLEEAPPPPQRSSAEHPPSVSGGPAAMTVPPVYPQVEWPPSPLLQQVLPTDIEKQQDCRSSAAMMHPFDGYVEPCPSPKKSDVAEEASLPATTNDGAQPTFRDAAGAEKKDGVKDAHGMHSLFEIGNQSSGQRKTVEISLMDQINGPMMSSGRYRLGGQESLAFHQQNGQEVSAVRIKETVSHILIQPTEQPRLGNGPEQQELRSSGVGAHVFNGYAELRMSPSKLGPVQDTLVPVSAKVGEATSGHQSAFDQEPNADTEDGHRVHPFGEIRNTINGGERKAVENAVSNDQKKVGFNDVINGGDRKAVENAISNDHKKVGLNEVINGVERKAVENAISNYKKVGFNEVSLYYFLNNAYLTIPWILKKLPLKQSAHGSTPAGVKRKLNTAASPAKKLKPLGKYSCDICHVNMTSQHDLDKHLGGNKHHLNVTAMLQASSSDTAEPSTKAASVQRTTTATNAKPFQNGKENVAAGGKPQLKSFAHHRKDADTGEKADWKKDLYCKLCDVQCNSKKMLASHLGGKKHREKLLEGGSV
ncbi:hypothetical protein HU200_059895 [Digitaria exilis]|uniref:C2H2-type domain-containing protein n=1 Tax=Digitaria exilis TaxID=1010633 RepID=A0A835DXZ0_9POAL|nr:hypothetical protein HU200_059895 [Digitaria exilis]